MVLKEKLNFYSAIESIIDILQENQSEVFRKRVIKNNKKGLKTIMNNKRVISVSKNNIDKFLGVKKFKHGEIENKPLVGVCTGLAWTEVGGGGKLKQL